MKNKIKWTEYVKCPKFNFLLDQGLNVKGSVFHALDLIAIGSGSSLSVLAVFVLTK